jgi:branched-chain amino acid transport system substrate-binding protein
MHDRRDGQVALTVGIPSAKHKAPNKGEKMFISSRARRSAALFAGLATIALSLAACGSSKSTGSTATTAAPTGATGATGTAGATAAGSKGTQTIVVIGDLSGQQRPGTLSIVAAIKSSINYFNSHGGWDGYNLNVDALNSNSDPTTAVSDLTKYLSTHSQKPILCWCGEEATESNALVPVSTSDGILSMSFTNEDNKCGSDAQSACPTYFASDVPPDYQGKAIANYFHTRGVTKVGLLEESITYEQGQTQAIEPALTALGIKFDKVSFPASAVDLTSEVSELKSDGVNGLFVETLANASAYALQARAKLSWNAPAVFSAAGSTAGFMNLLTPAMITNTYVITEPEVDGCLSEPGVPAFLNSAEAIGQKANLNLTTGLGIFPPSLAWDGMVTFHSALLGANSTDPKTLANWISNMPASAQTNPLYLNYKRAYYTPSDHQGNIGAVVSEFLFEPSNLPLDSNGQVKPNC